MPPRSNNWHHLNIARAVTMMTSTCKLSCLSLYARLEYCKSPSFLWYLCRSWIIHCVGLRQMLQLPMPGREDRLSATLPRTVSATCFSTALLDSWLQFATHVYRLQQLITHHQPLVRVACNLFSSQQHCLTLGFNLHTDSCLQIDYISPITNLLSE